MIKKALPYKRNTAPRIKYRLSDMKKKMAPVIILVVIFISILCSASSCDAEDKGYFIIDVKNSITASIMPEDSIEIVVSVKNISNYTMSFYPELIVKSDNEKVLQAITSNDGYLKEEKNRLCVEYASKTIESQHDVNFKFVIKFGVELENDVANTNVSFFLNYYRKNETFEDASKIFVGIAKKLIDVIIG